MKVLLIDADSKIPNIALMKLSSFYKSNGDDVELIRLNMPYFPYLKKDKVRILTSLHDEVYCSVVFAGNYEMIESFGDGEINFGGTGVSLDIRLPPEVEEVSPDYSIYPENKKVYGFLTRGCIRKCKFCFVPEKEGGIRRDSTLKNIIDVDFEYESVEFMDNNILAHKEHPDILREIIDSGIKCSFNQGLDIRLINEENSSLVKGLKYSGSYKFAFDDIGMMRIIERKLKILDWRNDWSFMFYMYFNPDMDLANLIRRIKWAKENKHLPYVMRDISCWGSGYTDFMSDIIQWCNVPAYFTRQTFEECLRQYGRSEARIDHSCSMFDEMRVIENNSPNQALLF